MAARARERLNKAQRLTRVVVRLGAQRHAAAGKLRARAVLAICTCKRVRASVLLFLTKCECSRKPSQETQSAEQLRDTVCVARLGNRMTLVSRQQQRWRCPGPAEPARQGTGALGASCGMRPMQLAVDKKQRLWRCPRNSAPHSLTQHARCTHRQEANDRKDKCVKVSQSGRAPHRAPQQRCPSRADPATTLRACAAQQGRRQLAGEAAPPNCCIARAPELE